MSAEQILEEIPDVEMDELKVALIYAAHKLDYSVKKATGQSSSAF
ncbi:hypothetical protein [Altericista sp. CCNU0014]